MSALNMIVGRPLIGIQMRVLQCKLMNVMFQSIAVRAMNHAQTDLTTFAPDRTDHGWTIILIRALPALFVGVPSWRVVGIAVFLAFFSRVLKHLIGFSPGIMERALRLHEFGIGLDRVPISNTAWSSSSAIGKSIILAVNSIAPLQYCCELSVLSAMQSLVSIPCIEGWSSQMTDYVET